MTPRHHNLDATVIQKLNSVIRGTANYFATSLSDVGDCFRGLGRWIRMRLRCMKYKRKRRSDNGRFRLVHFRRLGLCFLTELQPAPV
jgi:RNA-directed DNA polymerase